MTSRFLLSAAALAAFSSLSAPAVSARVHREVEKEFAVAAGQRATVSTQGGYIHVTTGDGDHVRIVAHENIRASSDEEADRLLKNLELTLEQDAAGVTAWAKYSEPTLGFHFGSWPPVQVDFEVIVPRSFSANLRTSGGDIRVGDLDGTLVAHTSGGNIRMGRIAKDVDADTSGGNVALEEAGADVHLSTSGGNLKVGPVAGRGDIRTSGGNIGVQSIGGPLSAHTSGGDIKVAFAKALRGDCSLSTSGGSVRVTLPMGAGCELDAATSGGSVQADGITIAIAGGGIGRSHLTGKVGSGGPQLRLRTSGGNVVIQAADLAAN